MPVTLAGFPRHTNRRPLNQAGYKLKIRPYLTGAFFHSGEAVMTCSIRFIRIVQPFTVILDGQTERAVGKAQVDFDCRRI